MQEAGHCLPAHGGRNLWRLALWGRARGEKAGGCPLNSRHTGQEEGEAISHLWSRIGILLQRGNAAILGNRVPALPRAHIDDTIKTVFFYEAFIECTPFALSLLDDQCVHYH